jgi:hypothetical protein
VAASVAAMRTVLAACCVLATLAGAFVQAPRSNVTAAVIEPPVVILQGLESLATLPVDVAAFTTARMVNEFVRLFHPGLCL